MKKIIISLLFVFFISACQTAREGFSLKKNDNSDEFLVEKKNPLVMPPDYNQLPVPEDFQSKTAKPENKAKDELENILKKSENKSAENTTKKSDIGQSVLEKIN
tara:strand:- start:239 stop:550 length:312 start_codon:yes stop_codon:yes gene_type:complete